jgi:4-amino-4-deoxy-L-arabinose transferase-like glycosyltransferase
LRLLKPGFRIYVLLALFVILGIVYSVAVPPFEASDELWHYPMAKTIADNWALPVQDPANVGPWRQEGSQAPLYYLVSAVATAWIDTSDIDTTRHLNPHADNGIATPDGNINLITHNPQAEAFPWRGTTLAVHVIRLLSVLMGAVTVFLTYRLSMELMPDHLNLALVAAAVNAFTPMFIFISAAVNNDNLVIPLSSLALLLMVRLLKASQTMDDGRQVARLVSSAKRFLPLGIVVGLALLAKVSAGGLIALTALTIAYVSWRERSVLTFFTGGLVTGGAALLIAGWWYFRNWRLYGDPLGQNTFIEILGQRDVPADLAQLWRERISFIRGYWGNFGGLNVLMPEWVYLIFNILALLALLGLVIALLAYIRRQTKATPHRLVSWLLVLLWPTLVVVLWMTWASTTWSSQGRLVFPAISVWSLLIALGWYRLSRLLPKNIRPLAFFAAPSFMFIISLLAPFLWIHPAYAGPEDLTDEELVGISQRLDVTFFHPSGGQLKLLGYDAPIDAARPGQSVPVTLYWEALEPFPQDYSVFLHLVNDQDLVPAQRDAFPGMGSLSTLWLKPSQRWAEQRILMLPETTYSPDRSVFEIGLYNYASGKRLEAVSPEGEIIGDHKRFGQLSVQAHPGDIPNRTAIDFGGEMELIGYDLDRRALRPGEISALTLYWRGKRPMTTNYSISTQFVDELGVKAAQKDAWPFDGAAPTSLWAPGEVVEESRELTILDGTPPGVYDVYVAVYPTADPDALLVVTPTGGRLQTDHVVLTTIRVLP